ncbi:MAG: pitrilysin family protein [Eubacteriales bacterium]|nr:pitrilysin family protein [Eubacteriales bacterium]MDD4475122.1 pitrilysin family protein [Eubacteriales bacterium]
MNRLKICEGVSLSVVTTEKFKTNFISVNLLAPLKKETASLNSLITNVLKRGCESYPTLRDINTRLDDLYASSVSAYVKKKGELQSITFAASMLDNSFSLDGTDLFAENLKLLSEIIFKPRTENGVFLKSFVDSEKKLLCDEISEQINNKSSYALHRCLELMCADEAYGVQVNGTIPDVQAITAESLYEQYRTVIASLPVEIFFVGNFEAQTVADYLKKYLCFSPRNDGSYTTEIKRTATSKPEFVEPMPVVQGKLSLGFRMGTVITDEDYPAFALFNELFGGSPSSLLFNNVREKLSLCYYCTSVPDAIKGIMVVASGIENTNKEKAETAILAQLKAIQDNNFTEEELTLARKSLINAYKEIPDSNTGLYNWYLSRIISGLSSSPGDAAKAISMVTREMVVEAAKRVTHEMTYFLKGTLEGEKGEQEND